MKHQSGPGPRHLVHAGEINTQRRHEHHLKIVALSLAGLSVLWCRVRKAVDEKAPAKAAAARPEDVEELEAAVPENRSRKPTWRDAHHTSSRSTRTSAARADAGRRLRFAKGRTSR